MMDAGQHSAALDLAGRAFGPEITAALRDNSGYLDAMLKRADALSKTEIISQEEMGRAVELKQRLEAAQKVLSEKFLPIQNDLAELGFAYRENWANIVEHLAAAVEYGTRLYKVLQHTPDWLAGLGNAPIWDAITKATTTAESRAASEASHGISSDITDIGMIEANNKLRAALQNRANVAKGMREATDVQSRVRGDTSKNPVADKTTEKNEFQKSTEAVEQHTAKMQADTKAVGLGASAVEQLRTSFKLLTSAKQAGLPVNDALIAKIERLANAAGEASEQLAKAKVNSEIQFDSRTALLSSDDAAIAQRLSGVFGNDVPAALASSQAATIRFNNALKTVSTSIETGLVGGLADLMDGTKSVSQSFADMSRVIVRALEEAIVKMLIIQPLMRGLSGGLGFGFADGGLIGGVASSPVQGLASGGRISGPGGPRDDRIPIMASDGEYMINAAATAKHLPLLEAINSDRIPKFADGGIVGSASSGVPTFGGTSIVAPSIAVTVQGSAGQSNTDHQKMGENIAKAAMDQMREMMTKELYEQRRPGGLLQKARR